MKEAGINEEGARGNEKGRDEDKSHPCGNEENTVFVNVKKETSLRPCSIFCKFVNASLVK